MRRSLIAVLALALSIPFLAVAQDAPPLPAVAYQGRLLEAGQPVTGARVFSFTILDSQGNSVWASGPTTLQVVNGLYATTLGTPPMPEIATTVLAKAGLKLRVQVGSKVLTPDMDLVPALQARSAFQFTGALDGDVQGTQDETVVMALQGKPLDLLSTPPATGQALVYDGSRWVARTQTGPVGPTGPTGPVGPQGVPGLPGIPGPIGPQGIQGIQGPVGLTGPQGDTGPVGATGPEGASPFTLAGNDAVYTQGSVGIGANSPAASALLEVRSTAKGFLLPRMTSVQRAAIASPATGLLVYQTDAPAGFYGYNGTAWVLLSDAVGTVTSVGATSPLASSGGTNPVISLSGALPVASGGTGSTTTSGALTSLGAAPQNNPTFTGTVTGTFVGGLTGNVAGNVSGNATTSTTAAYATTAGAATTATTATSALTAGSADTATTAGNVTGIVAVANGGTGAATAAGARTNLGLGSLATKSTASLTADVTGTLPVANGGTGSTDGSITGTGDLNLQSGGTGSLHLRTSSSSGSVFIDAPSTVQDTMTVYGQALATEALEVRGNLAVKQSSWGPGLLRFWKNGVTSTTYVGLRAPTLLDATYILLLPSVQGTAGQTLVNDGAGNLSWASPSGGTVTDVTGSAPIVSSGGTTPTISITAATGTAAGSMSSADKAKLDAFGAASTYAPVNNPTFTGTVTGSFSGNLTGYATTAGTAGAAGYASNAGSALTANSALTADTATTATNVTGIVAIANGGTGATTASGARTNLGAAASGANSDITSLSGLTTALSVAQGGTGATDAAGARTSLGAAPLASPAFTGSVGVGGAANASAALDVQSTTRGMLVPRMTAVQRGAIASPTTGLLVYQVDAPAGFYAYNGTAWVAISGATSNVTAVTGSAPIVSSGGATPAISITAATGTDPGSMSAADKAKLDAFGAASTYAPVNNPTFTGTVTGTFSGNLSGNATTATSATSATNAGFATLAGSATTANSALSADTATTAGNVTGTVTVAHGGTGATTLLANGVLLGNGTSAVQSVAAPATAEYVLKWNGSAWTTGPARIASTNGNTLVGSSAGSSITTGAENTIVGNGGGAGLTTGGYNVFIGSSTTTTVPTYPSQTVVGGMATSGADYTVAVGTSAQATGQSSTAVGRLAQATAANATALGETAKAQDVNTTAVGEGARAAVSGSVAVGVASTASAADAIALGTLASASGANSIVIGRGATSSTANAIQIGGAGHTKASIGGIYGVTPAGATQTVVIDSNGQLGSTTSAGGGSVTSVATGTGLTGGPITTSGTIALANTAVTAGSYTHASITVDAQGRLTAASNGAPINLASGVTGTLPYANGGTGLTTLGTAGQVLSSNGTGMAWATPTSGTVTSVTAGTGLSGGTFTTSGTISLPSTGVTAGTYTNPSIVVDAQGRITSATTAGINIVTGTTGTLTVARGGTGTTTGSITGPGALTFAAGGTNQNINLTPSGTGKVEIASAAHIDSMYVGQGPGTGADNTAVGFDALPDNTIGARCSAYGSQALNANVDKTDNTAVGYRAIYQGGASYNTAVGSKTLYGSNGGSNTAVGYNALNLSSGGLNVGIGRDAGSFDSPLADHSGQGNTFVGATADTSAPTANNQIAIGFGALVTGANRAMIGNDQLTVVNSYGTFTRVSDLREKENIQSLGLGLDFVLKLRPVTYNYLNQPGVMQEGLIAQEVEAAANSLGVTFHGVELPPQGPNGRYSLSYPSLVMPLINAVKELKAENDALRGELAAIRAEMAEIRAAIGR